MYLLKIFNNQPRTTVSNLLIIFFLSVKKYINTSTSAEIVIALCVPDYINRLGNFDHDSAEIKNRI